MAASFLLTPHIRIFLLIQTFYLLSLPLATTGQLVELQTLCTKPAVMVTSGVRLCKWILKYSDGTSVPLNRTYSAAALECPTGYSFNPLSAFFQIPGLDTYNINCSTEVVAWKRVDANNNNTIVLKKEYYNMSYVNPSDSLPYVLCEISNQFNTLFITNLIINCNDLLVVKSIFYTTTVPSTTTVSSRTHTAESTTTTSIISDTSINSTPIISTTTSSTPSITDTSTILNQISFQSTSTTYNRTTTVTGTTNTSSTISTSSTRTESLTTIKSFNDTITKKADSWLPWYTGSCILQKKRRRLDNVNITELANFSVVALQLCDNLKEETIRMVLRVLAEKEMEKLDEIKQNTESIIKTLTESSKVIQVPIDLLTSLAIISIIFVYVVIFLMDLSNIFLKKKFHNQKSTRKSIKNADDSEQYVFNRVIKTNRAIKAEYRHQIH